MHYLLDPAAMQALVLHRDACMLVIDKPAGIDVHVGAHGRMSIEQGFVHLQYGLPRVPSLAHRLDRETSGCLVLGRNPHGLKRLGELFASQQVQKTYLAVVSGAPPEAQGTVDAPILKSGQGSKWRITLDPTGQSAITDYRVLHTGDGVSVLALSPRTGRTHQLRVHCAFALGCPILGDPFYAARTQSPTLEFGERMQGAHSRLMLHAARVEIPFYPKKPPVIVDAPLPEAFRAYDVSVRF